MRHRRYRPTLHLLLLVLPALAAGLRAGLAAPANVPLPLPAVSPLAAVEATSAGGLAHAAFAVG